tara:strand:- start:251 stop:469 length:219 start_codon:yes stop_codon:yes gene_type:complete
LLNALSSLALSPYALAWGFFYFRRKKMNYKVELIVKVNEGHPRKWIIDAITDQLNDGEDVLEWDITEIEEST